LYAPALLLLLLLLLMPGIRTTTSPSALNTSPALQRLHNTATAQLTAAVWKLDFVQTITGFCAEHHWILLQNSARLR
jgi:hypothetical protein